MKKIDNTHEMSFLEHLEELRWRIIKILITIILLSLLGFYFYDYLIAFLLKPIKSVEPVPQIIFLKPAGMLYVRMSIALASGFVLALPIILYQFWIFIAPGLYKTERKFAIGFVFSTIFCFALGFIFAYFVILPIGMAFLMSMTVEDIIPQLDIGHYIKFVLQLVVVFGLVFELPVISAMLAKMGVISSSLLKKIRPFAIIIMFILAAFLTPPDPSSQVLMAVPLLLLYELSIIITKFFVKKET